MLVSPAATPLDASAPREAEPRASAFEVGGVRGGLLVPAYQAERCVGDVVRSLAAEFGCDPEAVVVVDDGSTDETSARARGAGAPVVRRSETGGKGAALQRGLEEARARGLDVVITVDADGQHPADSALALVAASPDPGALVLGVRDLARDGAPRKNRFSNGASNFFLSRFSGRRLADTQCGLRRYPVRATLALGTEARGYAFEAEVILRALHARVPLVEHPVRVYYPPADARVTHFDSVRDPARIVAAVVRTLADLRAR